MHAGKLVFELSGISRQLRFSHKHEDADDRFSDFRMDCE